MAHHLFEGLMKWEDSGKETNGSDGTANSAALVPGQAESYEKVANDDGTVDATHLPFDKNALAVSGFSYIALGHIHKPGILVENKAAFAGSPEPLDKTETGIHGAYYGEINPVSQKVEVLKYLPLCRSQY